MVFGHADAGSSINYHQVLVNNFLTDTLVSLSGSSQGGWSVGVSPSSVTAHPAMTEAITSTVGVPVSPTHMVDVERVTAVAASVPVTASGYMITFAGRRPFTDIAAGDWADDGVQYLYSQGAVTGYADGSFHPNEYVTRAQFAKMLVSAMGWSIENPVVPTFSDVAADSWAYGYIETAVAHSIIAGYPDGAFRPYNYVTRAQLAKMVVLGSEWDMEGITPVYFTDLTPDSWAYSFAQTAYSADVMSGYSDGSFKPDSPATRAQVAKVLTLSLFSQPNN